ncbi:hypothetical protein ACIPLC_15355 [Kitasatospora sp. NPDC086801]|uniref:hypothetical protein n=1 Tax=unclassified Kitasatospora TaxID=2633591 RepID=UPI003823BFD7
MPSKSASLPICHGRGEYSPRSHRLAVERSTFMAAASDSWVKPAFRRSSMNRSRRTPTIRPLDARNSS